MKNLINKRRLPMLAPIAFLGLAAVVSGTARAVDIGDNFQIHGLGYQNYMRTNTSTYYLGADKQGTWRDNLFSLLFVTKLQDRTKVWAKVDSTTDKSRLDWAFIDYEVNNNLILKAGQAKRPFGLYAQILDNKYLQLSTLPPMLYQDASDFIEKAYRGVGAVYDRDIGASSISLDAYAGQVVDPIAPVNEKSTGLRGLRMTLKTPVEGLKFMWSGYTTHIHVINTPDPDEFALKRVTAISADYSNNGFDIKAEYARRFTVDGHQKTYYLQAGYTFAEKWTPFARYDYYLADPGTGGNPANDPDLYQKTVVVGMDYKFNNYVGAKVENHFNRGWAITNGNSGIAGDNPGVKTPWNMFSASIYYIF